MNIICTVCGDGFCICGRSGEETLEIRMRERDIADMNLGIGDIGIVRFRAFNYKSSLVSGGPVLLLILAMSLLADSSPPPRIPGKRLFGNGGFNSHTFPSSFKRRRLDAVRGFPVSCGASASVAGECDTMQPEPNSRRNSTVDSRAIPCGNSPFNIKRPKVDGVRDFPERCGPFSHRTNGGESDRSADEESSLCSDVAKYVPPIAAVPLRSVPAISVQCDPEDSLSSPCKADDAGKMADGRRIRFIPEKRCGSVI
ncbi:UNVERIFIED_CONTAM: hypothetical protein Sangu_2494800 [Sesamum angustifolium]|uniref:Uncharacterized protein n=1 Tax=Sesamum angustifolium TaxID=2727405 RepID=A0AAW2KDF0_9LAMI